MKRIIHRALNVFGFDIILVGTLKAEIDRRMAEQERRHLSSIAALRRQRSTAPIRPESAPPVVWVSRDELFPAGVRAMADADVVLDIGCAFHPQKFLDPKVHICCEPFEEYMDRLMVETANAPRFVYLQCTIEQACALFPAASVDSVFLNDVIEHVDRDVAEKCLSSLKRIARRQVILFTPIGYIPQEPDQEHPDTDQWRMHGVEWQKHRSGWTPDDFPPGEGWRVIASSDFHQVDGYGRPLEKPCGAMWAIWNRQES